MFVFYSGEAASKFLHVSFYGIGPRDGLENLNW